MSTLTKARKDEIAKELEIASTWVGGPRQVKLLALAKEIGGLDIEEAQTAAEEHAAKAGAGTKAPTAAELKAQAKAEADAAAQAEKDAKAAADAKA